MRPSPKWNCTKTQGESSLDGSPLSCALPGARSSAVPVRGHAEDRRPSRLPVHEDLACWTGFERPDTGGLAPLAPLALRLETACILGRDGHEQAAGGLRVAQHAHARRRTPRRRCRPEPRTRFRPVHEAERLAGAAVVARIARTRRRTAARPPSPGCAAHAAGASSISCRCPATPKPVTSVRGVRGAPRSMASRRPLRFSSIIAVDDRAHGRIVGAQLRRAARRS